MTRSSGFADLDGLAAAPNGRAGRRTGRRGARRRWWPWLIAALLVVVLVAVTAAVLVRRSAGGTEAAGPTVPDAAAPATGAPPLGTRNDPIPDDALFVATTGSDTAPGTEQEPLKSVQHAVTLATPGQTIVVRGGSYNQRTTVTGDTPITIQPYPGEEVWFDGSVAVEGWRAEGDVWVRDDWVTDFDTSPTYVRGAPDNTEANWAFINPEFPLAAHPDQVWLGGVEQTQVATSAQVVAGTFAVDPLTDQLFIGTDPASGQVRASTKTKAFGLQSEGSVLRGVGIRGYATSVPGFGAVTVEAPGITIEGVVIEDNATTGLFVASSDATITDVTVRRNGMMGFGASRADRLTVTNLVSEHNNAQRFNTAPVSGGAKLTLSREVVIRDSRFADNLGPGLWFDQSAYDVQIVGNEISRNAHHGLFLEISSTIVVAGNTIDGNTNDGIKLNNSNRVEVWNNTITNNGRAMLIAQDQRRANDPSQPGRDESRARDDPVMTWLIDEVTLGNNVFSGALGGKCLLCVEDYSGERTAAEMGVELSGNLYQRRAADAPAWFIVWSRGEGDPQTFTTLADFTKGTGEERTGIELEHGEAADAAWLSAATSAQFPAIARTLPTTVREALGWPQSVAWVGAAGRTE